MKRAARKVMSSWAALFLLQSSSRKNIQKNRFIVRMLGDNSSESAKWKIWRKEWTTDSDEGMYTGQQGRKAKLVAAA